MVSSMPTVFFMTRTAKYLRKIKNSLKPIGMPFLNENQFLRKLKRIYIITYTPDWLA